MTRFLSKRVFIRGAELFVLALLVAGYAALASATPITYVFSGTASGTLGETPFTGKLLTVTASGDTDNVSFDEANTYTNIMLSTTITIEGVGTMTVTPGEGEYDYVFDNQFSQKIGYGVTGLPVGFCCDIIQFINAAYTSYDLKSSIGPFPYSTDLSIGDWMNVPTSMGPLTLTSYTNNTFTATLISQTQTLQPGGTFTYPAGGDNIKFMPFNNKGGEQLTITSVPVPQSVFDANPPVGFESESCVPYKDFSDAAGVPTCVEFQADCVDTLTSNDCSTFLYQVLTNYDLPEPLATTGIGGPDFLLFHGKNAPLDPSPTGGLSIFTEYGVNRVDPYTKGGGAGTGSVFVATYHPGATTLITSGATKTFVGFQSPVSNTLNNIVKAGSTVPLKWQQFGFDANGNLVPVTNLSLCTAFTLTGSVLTCTAPTGVSTPWVNIQAYKVPVGTCVGDPGQTTLPQSFTGNAGLLNQGNGNYQYNWKTTGIASGTCANIVLTYSSGAVITTQPEFQFK